MNDILQDKVYNKKNIRKDCIIKKDTQRYRVHNRKNR